MKQIVADKKMSRTLKVLGLILIIFGFLLLTSKAHAAFPEKPIKIVVYTGPGGLIDISARKFAGIASKYVDVNFVVENKPGAGGIVALKKVIQAPADGYNLYACTKSNIAKFVQVGGSEYIDALNWTAMLMADPECVITHGTQDLHLWPDIVANALQNPGEQNWVGPAAGGLDHVTALKIWDAYGMDAKWIPFKSGGKALAALLGEQGVAYVGNPRDALGNADLHIAAVSSPQRLSAFPDVPTFTELGMPGLENEYMWRGFALKKGTPPEVVQWYDALFKKVTADPDWISFWSKGGLDIKYVAEEAFTTLVHEDAKIFEYYLRKSNILQDEAQGILANIASGTSFTVLSLILVMIWLLCSYGVYRSAYAAIVGRVIVIGFFLVVSILFLVQSLNFPNSTAVGPAAVPRLWIYMLIPLNLLLLFKTFRNVAEVSESGPRVDIVLNFIGFLVVYLLLMQVIGYFLSTFGFVIVGLYYLGYRKWRNIFIISGGWILFSYLIFYKTLYVPLPLGTIFESLF
ncbi:MAG: tripartite tricarboxylate transporter substrate-binding protein [Candidatus Marinimicrobia bacterium]|nr:tripartite tricarboxylate transporter substrate-binding protein [Candidatus Neomarinimicrobiota bacterium]